MKKLEDNSTNKTSTKESQVAPEVTNRAKEFLDNPRAVTPLEKTRVASPIINLRKKVQAVPVKEFLFTPIVATKVNETQNTHAKETEELPAITSPAMKSQITHVADSWIHPEMTTAKEAQNASPTTAPVKEFQIVPISTTPVNESQEAPEKKCLGASNVITPPAVKSQDIPVATTPIGGSQTIPTVSTPVEESQVAPTKESQAVQAATIPVNAIQEVPVKESLETRPAITPSVVESQVTSLATSPNKETKAVPVVGIPVEKSRVAPAKKSQVTNVATAAAQGFHAVSVVPVLMNGGTQLAPAMKMKATEEISLMNTQDSEEDQDRNKNNDDIKWVVNSKTVVTIKKLKLVKFFTDGLKLICSIFRTP